MNSKLSMWKLLFSVASVGFLVTNCTLKTDTDGNGDTSCTEGHKKSGCDCADKSTGFQVCQDDGTYDACHCPVANAGGASSMGGTTSSGGAPSYAGKGGAVSSGGSAGAADAGAGGDSAGVIDPNDCFSCLPVYCPMEWDACAAEDEDHPPDPANPTAYCLSSDGKNPGQIEFIMSCITMQRGMGLAKRDVVRACGSTLGGNANPANFKWPPDDMTPATEGLMNCMADAPDEVMNPGAWATDPANYPDDGPPAPWLPKTCAKDACTSDQSGN